MRIYVENRDEIAILSEHRNDDLGASRRITRDVTFESMDDFSPAAIAQKVDALNKLLTTRTQLANLMTYMDGKGGAEELLNKVIKDPALLQALSAQAKPEAAPAAGEEA